MKGPRGSNVEQGVGLDYLLSSSKIPILLVREETKREKKTNRSFKWLIVLDKNFSFTMKSLNAFLPLIDPDLDEVHCNAIYPNTEIGSDPLKDMFVYAVERAGIKNYKYEAVPLTKEFKSLHSFIINRVNFEEVLYDFVTIYNNTTKYKNDPDNNDVANIIRMTNCNIGFVNN
jgi:hypothetical protein